MTAPFLLAFALIQAPNAVPQDLQLAMPTAEPVLAAGIKVEVVQQAAQEEVEAKDAPLTSAPITTATYVGVVPKRGPDCVAKNYPCPYLYVSGDEWGWNPLGWDRESRATWQTILIQQREFLTYNVGYQRGHAAAEAMAALARQAASNRSGGSSGRSYSGASSFSNAGGGRSSGSTWTGTSSGGSTMGSPMSRGRME